VGRWVYLLNNAKYFTHSWEDTMHAEYKTTQLLARSIDRSNCHHAYIT